MRTFWLKLHLYLGLAATLPIVVIAVTGVLLAFGPHLQAWTSPDVYAVEGETRMEATTVLRKLTAQYPDTDIHHLSMFQGEMRPWIGYVSRGKENFQLLVDPTTAHISTVTEAGWMDTVEHLHRTLTLGSIGRYVVGGSTIILVLLLVSGLYLWLPMWRGTFRRWIQRGTALGWHNAVGAVTLPLLLIMGVTGLTLTFAPTFMEGVFAITGSPELPDASSVTKQADTISVSLADAVTVGQTAHPGTVVTAVQQGGTSAPHEVHLARPHSANPHGWIRLWVDPHSGEILQTVDTYAHSVGSIYKQTWWQWHTGAFFGLSGRILWALACLMLPLLAVTGAYRWWKKRRAQTSPTRPLENGEAPDPNPPSREEVPTVAAKGPPGP